MKVEKRYTKYSLPSQNQRRRSLILAMHFTSLGHADLQRRP